MAHEDLQAALSLLSSARARGAELWLEGSRLRFRAPDGALDEPLRAELSARRAAVQEALSRFAERPTVELSEGQQALWLHHRMAPASCAYHVAFAGWLHGAVDVVKVRAALAALSQRHPVLSARVVEDAAGARQEFAFGPGIELVEERAATADDAQLLQRLRDAYERPFELACGRVARVHLIEQSSERRLMMMVAHHIAVDGWSLWLLLDELRALLSAQASGRSSQLGPVTATMAEVVDAERARLREPALSSERAYWSERLKDVPLTLDFHADLPVAARRSYRGASWSITLPSQDVRRLRTFAQANETTLTSVMLAAYATLLARYSGVDKLVVGVASAGRDGLRDAHVVGHLVNVVPVVVDTRAEDARCAVRAAQASLHEAMQHRHYPLTRMMEDQRARGGQSGIVQAALVITQPQQGRDLLTALSRGDGCRVDFGGLALEPFAIAQQEGQFEWTLEVVDTGEALQLHVKYDPERYLPERAQAFGEQLQTLLRALPDHAERSLDETLLGQSCVAPAQENVVYDGAETLAAAIREQVLRTPDAPALSYRATTISFAELDRRALRLAARLTALGAGPDTRVAVHVERSLELMVALLATVYSGAAYVPLDVEYPEERLRAMCEDSTPTVVICHAAALASWRQHGYRAIDVALRLDDAPLAAPRELPASALAYVIFTSGSTGRPKGAMNSQLGIVNRLRWMQRALAVGPGDVIMQKTPISFDVSVWELFLPLISGARLVLAEPGGHRDPEYLRALIEGEGVTVMHFVPSMLRAFLEGWGSRDCASLRAVVCSGEALPVETCRAFAARHPALLHNLYGPTEAAVDVTHWVCKPNWTASRVPIGCAIANTQIQIVDAHGRALLDWMPGELWIGGVQVGGGYIGRPELTHERFLPDPSRPGGWLYRTGDLARRRSDGAFEYLGRIDQQVKLRGVRIELEEIERCARELEGVAQAAACVLEQPQVLALVVSWRVQADERALMRELERRLPRAMVPQVIYAQEPMPLLPSGKLDRKAAQQLAALRWRESGEAGVEPGQLVGSEAQVAAAFCKVLQRPRIDPEQGFFAAGGDSLRAVELQRELGVLLGGTFGIELLFEHGSVRALAAALTGAPAQPAFQDDGERERGRERARDMRRRRSVRTEAGGR